MSAQFWLITSIVHTVGMLGLVGFAYADAHLLVLSLFAALVGVSSMPFSSMTRTRWTARLGRGPALERAYALEGMTDEAGFVLGPALVVWLTLSVAPPLGLLASLLFTYIAAIGLARVPEPRVPRAGSPHPEGAPAAAEPSVLSVAGMRAILPIFVAIGAIFGAVELVMVAFAEEQGQPGAASLLVSFFALGSLASALVYGLVTWRNRADVRLRIAVWTLGLCMLPILVISSVPLMAVMTLVTGLAISPATISATTLIERLSPPRKLTESFAWLGSSLGAGAAIGAMFSGFLIDWGGYQGGHLIALGAAALALVATVVWADALRPEDPEPEPTEPEPAGA